MEIVGLCDALGCMTTAKGAMQEVWLMKTAFILCSSANVISNGMLRMHGVFLNERTASFEDKSGKIFYRLQEKDGL